MDQSNERINESDVEAWVQNKLAVLSPPVEWQPQTDVALGALRPGRRSRMTWRRTAIYAATGIITAGIFLAFPATRVLAGHCVDACVAGTNAIGQLFGIKSQAAPLVHAPAGDRSIAPEFELPDANGKPVRLSSYRGKVIVLNFWATWCSPCKVEIPWFVDFQQRFGDLAVLGVSMDDGWNSVRPFLAKRGVNYPVVLGDDSITQQYGGVSSLPSTFIIDKQGRIAIVHNGVVSKDTYEQEITRLISEQ